MRNLKSIILGIILMFCLVTQTEANIILKVMAVNPSNELAQSVPVKVYLPKEIKPEDIANKGDLEVAYDTQQGSYYVYGYYELKPGESIEKEIELRDVWVTPASEIESLRLEADKIVDLLKNTGFAERIKFLKNGIDSKLNQIIENQKNSPANPADHISEYRDNLKILDSVKADMALARSLLAQVKPRSFTFVVWRLIIAMVIFLGFLGGGFYIIWQKQLKTMGQDDISKESQKTESVAGYHKAEDKQSE